MITWFRSVFKNALVASKLFLHLHQCIKLWRRRLMAWALI